MKILLLGSLTRGDIGWGSYSCSNPQKRAVCSVFLKSIVIVLSINRHHSIGVFNSHHWPLWATALHVEFYIEIFRRALKCKNLKTLTCNSWGILVGSVTRSKLLKRGWIDILIIGSLKLLLSISTPSTHYWKVCIVLLLVIWRAWWSTKCWLLAHLLLPISLTFINRFVYCLHHTLMAFFID